MTAKRPYKRKRAHNRPWAPILEAAVRIALSYTTAVTLRQLHYRLIGIGGYENNQDDYGQLSRRTAEMRREGEFPALSDTTRKVSRPASWADPEDAAQWLAQVYRRDRTEGQKTQQWMLYEKSTLSAQIDAWTRELGIPNAALRGYSSESLEREIFESMLADGRPVVAWYLGDLDPEGVDIERNFKAQARRMGITFKDWDRLGVTPTQVTTLGLPPQPGKPTSSRAAGFIAEFGTLFQIEIEAVDPAELRRLVTTALAKHTNKAALKRSKDQEWIDREVIEGWG